MKTNIYIIGFDETSNFMPEIYSMKRIKSLRELNINLNAVFAEDFEKFIGVKKYCLNHQIETISTGRDYFISILRYSMKELNKKNLATLISEKKASNLNWLFRQDPDFNSQII